MASKSIRTVLAGAAALLSTIALPVVGHANTYPIDESGFGDKAFGNVTAVQDGLNTLKITVALNNKYHFFVGPGSFLTFTTNESIALVPSAGLTLKGDGTNADIKMGKAGTFGAGIKDSGKILGQTLVFDITGNGLTVADLIKSTVKNGEGNFFAVSLIKSDHDHDRDGRDGDDRDRDDRGRDRDDRDHDRFVAWAPLDPPSATPIPGALALFAPVIGVGYMALRRRRRCNASGAQ